MVQNITHRDRLKAFVATAPLNPSTRCAPLDLSVPDDQAGLSIEAQLPADVAAGSDFTGALTIRSLGATTVSFHTDDPVQAAVLAPGTTTVVGTFVGAIAGVGANPTLAPGDEVALSVVGGTAACNGHTGYHLPPGIYDLIVTVPRYGSPGEQPRVDLPPLISSRVPLAVR